LHAGVNVLPKQLCFWRIFDMTLQLLVIIYLQSNTCDCEDVCDDVDGDDDDVDNDDYDDDDDDDDDDEDDDDNDENHVVVAIAISGCFCSWLERPF